MAPLRVSTTKSEWLPDDPTDFVPTMLWKLPSITTWDDCQNQNQPTDSAEEAFLEFADRRDSDIVELKLPATDLDVRVPSRDRFSAKVHAAVAQLRTYRDW